MKRSGYSLLAVLFIGLLLWLSWWSLTPRLVSETEGPLSEFSTSRVFSHLKTIASQPHYVGSEAHGLVADYLEKELKNLGLETTTQEGTTLTEWGNLVPSKNILARIKGSDPNGKALVLLSHYDSAPHSFSHGASDDGSGVAVILEGLRAFLHQKAPHKNDLIILFSDAEELGLNGAALFVTQHQWAKEVGVVLNFEARGTSGPGYMLMEVNEGNAQMIEAFAGASVPNPVTNSLMYSIYKMLPNDTDLTVFREQGNIQGFNFAFIDNHFNYHTRQDDFAHLDRETIAHQGSYLMPLLQHLSNSDLSHLNSPDDQVYFGIPYALLHYSFSWNIPLVAITAVLFLFIIFIGLGKRMLQPVQLLRGFVPLLGAMAVAGGLTFFGWKILQVIYPQYQDIQQGFTYNGHDYLAAFLCLSVSVAFLCYSRIKSNLQIAHATAAPILLWILITLGLALQLPGAGFFIWPVFASVLMLGIFIGTQRQLLSANLLLAIPALLLLAPFTAMFPIGLGLKMLAGSAALTVLIFALLLPIFATFERKLGWALLFFVCFIGFTVKAHFNSDYAPGHAKPNSLLYVYNADTDQANWVTYDREPDVWTRNYLGEKPKTANTRNNLPLFSKYEKKFTFTADAMPRDLPEPTITFLKDLIVGEYRWLKIRISPNRKVNRYDIFAAPSMKLHHLKANGVSNANQKGSFYQREGSRVLSYYVTQNKPLELQFAVRKNTPLNLQLLESSLDLMRNPLFSMQQRPSYMMPMPFVLTDAICVIKKINPSPKTVVMPLRKTFSLEEAVRDTIPDPDDEQVQPNVNALP